jgi:hypothetical protein
MRRRGKGVFIAVGIAVALALIVVASAVTFFPQPSKLSVPGSGNPEIQIAGTIWITTASGGGILNLTAFNAANYPVTSINVSAISPDIPGIANNVPFTFKGVPLSASNPQGIGGAVAIGTLDFSSGAMLGTNYTVTVKTTLSDGQVITEREGFVAQTQSFYGGISLSATAVVTNQTTGAGVMNITIFNMANNLFPVNSTQANSIINITMTRGPGFSPIASDNVIFSYNGAPVSKANPLPIGATATTGTLEFNGGALIGETYPVTVVAILASGESLTGTVDLAPQG